MYGGASVSDPTVAARATALETAMARMDMPVQVAVPTAGATVTCDGSPVLALNHSSLILTLTVALPASPRDGQQICVGSRSAVTTLTMTHAKTIQSALTAFAALGYGRWVFSSTVDAWVRVG